MLKPLVSVALCLGAAPLLAQESVVHPPQTAFIRAEAATADSGLNVPVPPRGVMPIPAKHGLPPVPQVDLGMPMPSNPATSLPGVGPRRPAM